MLRVVPPQAPTFQPNLDAFAQMLTEKVTCVLINTPNNPTGVVYSADTLTRMAAILTEKSAQYGHNIFLVSDEPYRDIVFDGKTVPYPAAFYPHTLTCFSYSKSLSLPTPDAMTCSIGMGDDLYRPNCCLRNWTRSGSLQIGPNSTGCTWASIIINSSFPQRYVTAGMR